jgi:hypothetical protein
MSYIPFIIFFQNIFCTVMFNDLEFGTISFMEKICSLPPLVAKHVYVYSMTPPFLILYFSKTFVVQ